MEEKKNTADNNLTVNDDSTVNGKEKDSCSEADSEDINHFIKSKPKQNRWIILLNCLKEVIFVILLFIIVNSQLYTAESLDMRKEIQTRFSLIKPDYLANQSIEFNTINSFIDFYRWIDGTFLPRMYMDPYYSSLQHNGSNWTSHSSQHRLLQEISEASRYLNSEQNEKTIEFEGLERRNNGDARPQKGDEKGGAKKDDKRPLLSRESQRIKASLDRARAFHTLIEADYEKKKNSKASRLPSWNERESTILEGFKKSRDSIQALEKIYIESTQNKDLNPTSSTLFYGDKGIYQNFSLQSFSEKQTPNSHLHRLLQYSGQVVTIVEDSKLLYHPQFLNMTKSPIFFNKLITTIRFRSRMHKAIERHGKTILTHDDDTGSPPTIDFPYSAEEGSVCVTRCLRLQPQHIRKELGRVQS